jgi:hypothetical protein
MPAGQQKMWEKAKDTLNQAESAAYINIQGHNCMGTNITYVCYGHRKDPLGKSLANTHCCPTLQMMLRNQSMMV